MKERVEKFGVRMAFLQQHAREWTDVDWEQRRDRVLAELAGLETDLRERGETFEQHGWTWMPRGIWHRVGEDSPTLPLSENEGLILETLAAISGVCPGGAIPWCRVHWPELWEMAVTAIGCLDEVVEDPTSVQVIADSVVEAFAAIGKAYEEKG